MFKQLRIMNFQSIEDLTYNFSEGLNVIVAPNNVGKSIINKIIEVLVNFKSLTSEDMLQYITFGKPKSDLFFSSEKESYWVEIYPRKINYYVFENSNFKFVGNELPKGLIDVLGLLICDGGFIGNLITSNHSKLLVDSSANINNQILSLIARDDNAESILEECEERLSVMNSNLRNLKINKSTIQGELSTIHVEDTTQREDALKRVFNLTLFVEELITVHENSTKLKSDISKIPKLDGVLQLCSDLENIDYKFLNVRDVKEVRNMDKDLRVASELESILDRLDLVSSKLSMLTEVKPINVNQNLIGLTSKLESIQFNLSKISNVKLPSIEKIKSCDELDQLVSTFNEYALKLKSYAKDREELKLLKEEIDSYGGEVYDCPIYGSIKFVNEECIHNYN